MTARLLAVGCAGGVAVTLLSGCGSTAGASGDDLVSLKQARQIALDYLHAPFPAELAQERGSLQAIDQSVEAMSTPGAAATPDARIHDVTVWLAHQSRYPISFLILDKTVDKGPASPGAIFRFGKESASAGWTVTYQIPLASIASRPAVALNSDGYAQLLSPSDYDKLLVSPASLAKDWTAYLTAGNVGDGHEFAPGTYTSGEIENRKAQIDADAKEHHARTFTYSAGDDPVDAYLLKDGSALVLSSMRVASRTVAETGWPIKVTDDGKNITGPAPGSYREVDSATPVLAAFTVPAKGSAVKVTVIGAYYAPVTTKGIPA